MKIPTKTRYGTRAMLEIALNFAKGPIKRDEIVKKQDIPKAYLENILIMLKNAGLIKAIRGPRGGFTLATTADKISLLDVIQVFHKDLEAVPCIESPELCKKTLECITRKIWNEIAMANRAIFLKYTLQDLVNMKAKEDNFLNFEI